VSRHCRSALNEHQCNNIYAMPCNMAIAASAPMRNAIAGNSVMSESNASIVPSSHNMWRSISTNLVMPVEFESMMLPCSDSWRSIAGNLKMPAEFANMLPSDSWRSIAGNLSMPTEFANMLPPSGNICLQCYGDHPIDFACSSSNVDMSIINQNQAVMANVCRHCLGDHPIETACLSDTNLLMDAASIHGQPHICLFCGGDHILNQACPCFRCGHQHKGDCQSICPLCRRSHAIGSRCRANAANFTARRRMQAIFCDDDDIVDRAPPERHFLGLMVLECPYCKARSWRGEKLSCCHHGAVHLPLQDMVPAQLSAIILSPHVRQNIRPYNTIMAFASTGHQNKSIVGGTFVLGGRAYHRIGSLLPGKHVC
jgi:hypothetical protein